MNIFKLGLTSILAAGALYAGTYNVDAAHSSVGFKVKHMMISNVTGTFDKFSGSYEYDEKTNTLKSLNGVVEVTSVNTANAKRDGHLKSSDFFAADKYPQITFKVDKVEGDKAYGKFTLRGVTKDIVLDVETGGSVIKDPWGQTKTGVTLTGKINRMDYGVKYNSVIEAGGVTVGEIVKLNIELAGVLAK
jgi:polyisoprenoid-binding protein YceI